MRHYFVASNIPRSVTCKLATVEYRAQKRFFPFTLFSYQSFSLSYLEPQIIFPCPDIGPATATLDPRPRHWTRDCDFGPATISQTRFFLSVSSSLSRLVVAASRLALNLFSEEKSRKTSGTGVRFEEKMVKSPSDQP